MQPLFFNPVEKNLDVEQEHDTEQDHEYSSRTKEYHVVLTLADLPPCEGVYGLKELDEVAVHRASQYFQRLVQNLNHTHETSPVVMLPSACELTSHLHCSEIHIFEALQTLLSCHYEFEIRGLDGPICLKDPHYHKRKGPFGEVNHDAVRTENPWHAFAKQFHLE